MPTSSPWDPKLRPDVAILIALPEEFQSLAAEYAHQWYPQANPNYPGSDFLFVGPGDYRCVATIMPRMGPVMASQTSTRLLAWRPSVILNVGIAGGFKDDVRIGDVIVPRQVDAYDETGKIKDRRWERRGSDYRPSVELVTAVQELQFTSRDAYASWVKAGAEQLAELQAGANQARVNALLNHRQLRDRPIISTNHLASGSFVVASRSFAEFIRRANADIHAGEMEAAGMMAAAEYWRQGPMTLVVRGISDHVNADKSELDAIGDGALRRLAMANAWRLVCTLMTLGLLPRSEGRAKPQPSPNPVERSPEFELLWDALQKASVYVRMGIVAQLRVPRKSFGLDQETAPAIYDAYNVLLRTGPFLPGAVREAAEAALMNLQDDLNRFMDAMRLAATDRDNTALFDNAIRVLSSAGQRFANALSNLPARIGYPQGAPESGGGRGERDA